MIPVHLYIENFSCHEKSIIDFTQFSSALIVGKMENSDLHSNGVGKTTIFKAIEYALFNASDVNLEKLIRDDCNACKVVFDFKINDQLYRVCRLRTKKGTSDVSLFERNAVEGDQNLINDPSSSKDYWKDVSGRRAPDTEKDLAKLIKINAKSFRSTVHFAQNDFTGITSATPEKRKALLKEVLSLSIYSKLEKMSKDKASALSKQIDKNESVIENLSGSEEDLNTIKKQIIENNNLIFSSSLSCKKSEEEIGNLNQLLQKKNLLIQEINNENKFLLSQKEKTIKEKSQIEVSIADFSVKKNNLLTEAKSLANELKIIKDKKDFLSSIDYSIVLDLNKKFETIESESREEKVKIESLNLKIEELKVPLPEGSSCSHCRQNLSKEHLENCKVEIDKELTSLTLKVKSIKESINLKNQELKSLSAEIKNLNNQKTELNSVIERFTTKEQEIKNKKEVYNEYTKILDDFNNQLNIKKTELEDLDVKINSSSLDTIEILKKEIISINNDISYHQSLVKNYSNQISSLTNKVAVLEHSSNQIKENLYKKKNLVEDNNKLKEEYKSYPNVIDAFSSTGIPNLIIQNLLDELQEESNKLLNNLKPGLQLQFVTEKEKKDGTANDTLDILYFVQGKSREYEQLSGAMKLAVNFSLKLGLSFLLQNMFDTKINMLLLDEIDQSLDKAGVDAFADIVKFFQKDFTTLVITHNDRLKDKFSSFILVEQDRNMVSKAKVVSSW